MNVVEAMLSKLAAATDLVRAVGTQQGAPEGHADFAELLQEFPRAARHQTPQSREHDGSEPGTNDAPATRNPGRFLPVDEEEAELGGRNEASAETGDVPQPRIMPKAEGQESLQPQPEPRLQPIMAAIQPMMAAPSLLTYPQISTQPVSGQPAVNDTSQEISGNSRAGTIGMLKSEVSMTLASLPQRSAPPANQPLMSPAPANHPLMPTPFVAGDDRIGLPGITLSLQIRSAARDELNVAPVLDSRVTVTARTTHFASAQPSVLSQAMAFQTDPAAAPTAFEMRAVPAAPDLRPASTSPELRPAPSSREIASPVAGSTATRDAVADSARSAVSAARDVAAVAPSRVTPERTAAVETRDTVEPDVRPAITGLPSGQLDRIASAIVNDAASAPQDTTASQSLSGRAAAAPTAHPAPVRNLTIQLNPEDLGRVQIELRVRDGALSVKVRPEHDETARLIENDREVLTDLLRSAGHDIENVTIQALPRETAQAGVDLQSSPQRGQSQTSSQGDRQAGAEDRPSQGQPEGRRNPFHQGHENHGKQTDGRTAGRGLYV